LRMLLQYNIAACRALSRNVQALRFLQTSVARQSVKTPIQDWGWEYLMRQRAMMRPISPHLKVYKPMLTWMVSGFHRMTGCAMAGKRSVTFEGSPDISKNIRNFIKNSIWRGNKTRKRVGKRLCMGRK
uniref:Succinate dehydrogenase cytochrome b560 subunit, mitochondrial n=1 Tax=Gongylonema pulchrum TaxID=637853 RepID=A0A183EVD6_9BILA